MPRHNNRKHYPHEGKLGFDSMKYIGTNPSRKGKALHTPVRMDKESGKRHVDRHKAHAPTKKQRRALAEIKLMHKGAELVWDATSTESTPTPASAFTTTSTTITPINN